MITAVTAPSTDHDSAQPAKELDLTLTISEPNVVVYLSAFPSLEIREAKAIDALKVGVIAIQSASPTLDTRVVQAKFDDLEGRLKEYLGDLQKDVADNLGLYFKDHDGIIPRSLDGVFGKEGQLGRKLQEFFDPAGGQVGRLLQAQLGPDSAFRRALDPKNKDGILSLIEARVQMLVEARLGEVLRQFSLDHDESAMSKLKGLLTGHFQQLNESLGIKLATTSEAQRGHVKGIEFEKDLYEVFAALGRQLGDETELVRGLVGDLPRSKKGDFVAVLGDTTGAPGERIVVEVKDQALKLKDSTDELQEAKKNRGASIGIFVYARGCEPAEVGDFRRVGDDFYCTVDKDALRDGQPLMFFDSAYKIVRTLAVAAVRKDAGDGLDLDEIDKQVGALAGWSEKIADMATKARTVQSSGKIIEDCAAKLKQDLDQRVSAINEMLRRGQVAEG